jgi:integrase
MVMLGGRTARATGQHLARFILVGPYTGTRSMAICEAALTPAVSRGWVDLERGVFHRRAIGRRATNKRQPPVRIPRRLLAHLRRCRDRGISAGAVVEWQGRAAKSVKKAFRAAVEASGMAPLVAARLGHPVEIVPHLLRHTAATWLMQAGVPTWEAAGFLGMTERQLIETYGHHHPDFQEEAATAFTGIYGQ